MYFSQKSEKYKEFIDKSCVLLYNQCMEKSYFDSIYPYTIISSNNADNAYTMQYYHKHFTLEIFYLTSGSARLNYYDNGNDLQTSYLLPGQFFIILPETKHKFFIDEQAYFMVLELGLEYSKSLTLDKWLKTRESLQNCTSFLKLLQKDSVLTLNDTQEVYRILSKLLKVIHSPSPDEFFALEYEVLLKWLLIEISRCKATSHISRGNRYIIMSERFIEENYMHPIKTKDIADHLQINPIYLESLVKKELGKTLGALLAEYRIKKSLDLLSDHNMSIQNIAKKVGYNHIRTFQIAFYKLMQTSPLQYRSQKSHEDFYKYTADTAKISIDDPQV